MAREYVKKAFEGWLETFVHEEVHEYSAKTLREIADVMEVAEAFASGKEVEDSKLRKAVGIVRQAFQDDVDYLVGADKWRAERIVKLLDNI